MGWVSGLTPPRVDEEPWVTNRKWVFEDINPSLPPQAWLWTWIPDGSCELALCFADKSWFCHVLGIPPDCCTSPALGLARDPLTIQGVVLLAN